MTESTGSPHGPLFREVQTGFLAVRLVTEVRSDGVYVKFTPLHRSFHRIPWRNIDAVTDTTHEPMEYGGWGWGIRVNPTGAKKAYRISGDSGVEIRRTDGRDLFVGTRRPSELVETIDRARGVGPPG
jgi:hypothetical protein